MLRALVLLLLLANVAFWAYTGGHLARVGLAPHDPREPQRLAAQVAPDELRVLNAAAQTPAASQPAAPAEPENAAAPPVSAGAQADIPVTVQEPEPVAPAAVIAPAPAVATVVKPAPPTLPAPPTTCWQLQGLSRPQGMLVRAALENFDGLQGRWSLTEGVLPARWIVYLGPFANAGALQQRRAELRRAGVEYRELSAPNLAPGLALGTYSTPEAARRTLGAVTQQGVSGARVVQERADTPVYTLKLEGISDAQRRRIEAMRILGARSLQRCP